MSTEHDVIEQARGWSDAVLACRANAQHAYVTETWEYVRAWGYYHITSECARGCGVVRHKEQDAEGYLIGHAWLDYAANPDYLSKGGRVSAADRAVIRQLRRERTTVTTTTADRPPRFKAPYAKVAPPRRRSKAVS